MRSSIKNSWYWLSSIACLSSAPSLSKINGINCRIFDEWQKIYACSSSTSSKLSSLEWDYCFQKGSDNLDTVNLCGVWQVLSDRIVFVVICLQCSISLFSFDCKCSYPLWYFANLICSSGTLFLVQISSWQSSLQGTASPYDMAIPTLDWKQMNHFLRLLGGVIAYTFLYLAISYGCRVFSLSSSGAIADSDVSSIEIVWSQSTGPCLLEQG